MDLLIDGTEAAEYVEKSYAAIGWQAIDIPEQVEPDAWILIDGEWWMEGSAFLDLCGKVKDLIKDSGLGG